MLPPGRAKLATNPLPTGSLSWAITIGIVEVASLSGRVTAARRDDDVHLETHQLGSELGQPIDLSVCRAPLDDDVLTLDIPKLAQTLAECLDAGRDERTANGPKKPIRGIFVGCCAWAETLSATK